jgi:hypothetical protein
VGGGPSTAEWIAQSDAVVIVLTKALVTDPDALFEIWTALSLDVPIITVAVVGMYDFAHAATKFSNLPLALEKAGEERAGKSPRRDVTQRSQASPRSQRSTEKSRSAR